MRFTDCLSAGARVVELEPRDDALGRLLVAMGHGRYLGVVKNERRWSRVVKRHPSLKPHLAISSERGRVRQNNADVLVLNGAAALHLVRFRNLRHARYVAVTLAPGPILSLAVMIGLLQFLLGRLAWPTIVRVTSADTSSRMLVLYRVRRPRPYTAPRRFIPHSLGVAGFLARLERSNVRHAVLRWFDSLPKVAAGEDLDLLVDDEQLAAVRSLLDSGPGLQPVDVYSVNGAPGADFRDMPYFPPYLANELLDRAIVHRNLCRVPSSREHFLSLAYHAVYHKGAASGLPRRRARWLRWSRPEHDYGDVLRRLADSLGIDVPITLADLDAYLDSLGWRPPHDMLCRLSRKNSWLRSLVKHARNNEDDDTGLAVFVLRRIALERGGVAKAVPLIEDIGFQIVATLEIDERHAEMVTRCIRGGNWGPGPWKISGGPPVAAIVAYDFEPTRPTRQQKRQFPFLANGRLRVKSQVRAAFNAGYPEAEHCNVVHSSDNGREAIDYLRIIAPESVDDILAKVRKLERMADTETAATRKAA